MDNSFGLSLFSTNNLTAELLTPRVAIDLVIVVKFRKLPIIAIPEVPKKTAIIFEENRPKTKLTTTETEFIDKTLKRSYFFS